MRQAAFRAFAGAALVLAIAVAPASAAPLAFSQKQYVDPGLAGGEPLVFADTLHGTLIYTSHEGTTHLYQPGLVTTEPAFYSNYRDQVNIWTSSDGGKSWQATNFMGTGFVQNPSQNLGFSDPDLTQDAGGRVYNTGIDLANDALFSTIDGGKTWDRGTPQCEGGDRPWLAGGKADEVFFENDPNAGTHQIKSSTDGGNTCNGPVIPDQGGYGKLLYDRKRDTVLEPHVGGDLSIATWHRGDAAFTEGALIKTTLQGHFPSTALDDNGTLYFVWDTDERADDTTTGCQPMTGPLGTANNSPLANSIMMATSHDLGKHWDSVITVAHPGTRVLWPWVVAGDAGKVNVVWYQSDKVVDFDCQASNVSIYSSTFTHADDPATRTQETAEASHGPIHTNGVCQGGTTCVATGQDRRLGDFFTNALDPSGCVMIASGDTMVKDPLTGRELPTSLPIIIRQVAGPALRGDTDCNGSPAAKLPPPPPIVPACHDKTPPTTTVNKRGNHLSRHHIVVSGKARDSGCGGASASTGALTRVDVAVGRELGHGRCRFLFANAKFGSKRSCSKPTFVRARGTATWHLDFVAKFAPGRYRVAARAVDSKGNHARKLATLRLRLR